MAATTMLALLVCVQIRPLGPDQTPPLRPVPTMGAAGAAVAAADADNPMLSEAMRGDARLADVCFAGPQQGWAVGDRGVIWHTEDGGRRWYLQPSGVGCTLASVCFLDEKIGWVAGGFSHPYTHASSGVLLTTTDGGRHWQSTAGTLLPALKQIRFFDEKHGWAVACPSAMFPSGVLTTDNGGRSWSPLSGTTTAGWLAGDLLDPRTGALAGRSGKTAMVRDAAVEPVRMGSFGLRNLRRMALVAPVHGWLVGDGGLLMMTGDLGASWQSPPGPLPEGLAEQFDFQALAVRGPQAWVAGAPGTRVLHSPDAGRTWQAFATGVQTPIHGLAFADDQHGWAVGALGTILATSDGGQSWQRQRAGGGRAALLGLFGDGRDVPLELFAQHSGDDGYLGVVELLNRRDVEVESRSEAHPADRVHEALVGVGGSDASTAWRFPLRQAGLTLSAEQIIGVWDQVNDGRGLAELEAHVVRQIRMWRPEVIVTHGIAPGGDPLGQVLNQVVLRAVAEAADPTQFTRQITHVGLEPWEVKKVYGMLDHGAREGSDLSTAQLAVRLGGSLADIAAMPRGLLEDQFTAAEATLGFRLLIDHLPQGTGQRDMFSGIVLSPGSDARRPLAEVAGGNLAALQAVAQRQRNVRAILQRSEKDPQGSAALLAQTGQLIQGLDGGSAGRMLYQLGQSYYHAGRWPAAADTFELLAQRYPDHPLAQPAMLWLVQYYAGSEPAWRVQGEQRYAVQQASALSIDVSQQDHNPDHAAQLAKQIEQTRPDLFLEEALRFPLAVAHRNQGFPRQAERYFLARAHGADDDAWSACARGEQWLAEPKGLPPKPLLHCAVAEAKPLLDGRLDDAVWRRAVPAELHSAQRDDAQWPAVVRLAYDAEFLYVAIQCQRPPGAESPPLEQARTRDPDLSSHDRVEILLDLDRDFATYYRLTIDHRGQPAEDCWGDRTWNPTWFVAANREGDTEGDTGNDTGRDTGPETAKQTARQTESGGWTAEAAIPLDQLTGRFPTSRAVWAVGIQRIVPGAGFQSWTTPAAIAAIPEGFGYLVFD